MIKYLFIISLVFASLVQGVRYFQLDMIDGDMWASQAKHVQTHDERQFNAAWAYGHPGGPLIEGTIAVHTVFNVQYKTALFIVLALFNGLAIAAVTVFTYLLRKNILWSIVTVCVLSLHQLYNYATPPSALASCLVVLLCIFTLYLFENRQRATTYTLLGWGSIAGLLVATRFDIGMVSCGVFILLLKYVVSWKKIFLAAATSVVVFFIADPFMWFMPIQHIKDLFGKIIYHYAEYTPSHINFQTLMMISLLTFISMILALIFLVATKKLPVVVPPVFMIGILVMSIGLYIVYLTAHYQAIRYFQPIIFIWELVLPLFLFQLISKINMSFCKTPEGQIRAQWIANVVVSAVLIVNPLVIFMFLLTY